MKPLFTLALALLALGAQAQQGTPPQPSKAVAAPPPPTQAQRALNAANGVGDLRFGTARTKFSQLVQADTDGPVVYYKRKHDRLTFGTVALPEVLYGFYHDKLALIRARTPDEASSQAVLRELVARYGYGYRAAKLPERHGMLERLTWVGDQMTLIYTFNTADKDATILVSSNALAEQRLREKAGATN